MMASRKIRVATKLNGSSLTRFLRVGHTTPTSA